MNQSLAKVLYVAGVTTFCTFLGCWAVLAHQENTPTQKQGARRANAPYSDEVFLRNAAEGSLAEIKLGQLAEEKAESPEVKTFAKRMVEVGTGIRQSVRARDGEGPPEGHFRIQARRDRGGEACTQTVRATRAADAAIPFGTGAAHAGARCAGRPEQGQGVSGTSSRR